MKPENPQPIEYLPPDDSNFIPEVEIDPTTGKPKSRPYQQKPYEPLTEYGG